MVVCDYCGENAERVSGLEVYPHRVDLRDKVFWVCWGCDARVGCHPGGDRPLGRLADAELRQAKKAAHAAFDPLWRRGSGDRGLMSRAGAYRWLATELGIDRPSCHIGMFDVDTCRRVVGLAGAKVAEMLEAQRQL